MTSQSPTPKLSPPVRPLLGPWRLWEESPWSTCLAALAYLAVAALCFMVSRRAGLFWLGIADFYFVLGIDRYLGVLARISAMLRKTARAGGWYWSLRRPAQALIMLAIAAVIAVVFYRMLKLANSPAASLALAAGAFSGTLVVLRAISFHEFDMLLYRKRKILGGGRANLLIEFFGLAMAAVAALIQ